MSKVPGIFRRRGVDYYAYAVAMPEARVINDEQLERRIRLWCFYRHSFSTRIIKRDGDQWTFEIPTDCNTDRFEEIARVFAQTKKRKDVWATLEYGMRCRGRGQESGSGLTEDIRTAPPWRPSEFLEDYAKKADCIQLELFPNQLTGGAA